MICSWSVLAFFKATQSRSTDWHITSSVSHLVVAAKISLGFTQFTLSDNICNDYTLFNSNVQRQLHEYEAFKFEPFSSLHFLITYLILKSSAASLALSISNIRRAFSKVLFLTWQILTGGNHVKIDRLSYVTFVLILRRKWYFHGVVTNG